MGNPRTNLNQIWQSRSLYLTKVINLSKFGVDWFGSFGSGEAQNSPFPIGTTTGPYHCSATALARDDTITR